MIDGQPFRARGCLLPDDEVTVAICLAARGDVQVWTRTVDPSKHSCRRGRLVIDPGIALCFLDEPAADISVGFMIPKPSLERDLVMSPRIQVSIRSKLFTLLLYVALWSVTWSTGSPESSGRSVRAARNTFMLAAGAVRIGLETRTAPSWIFGHRRHHPTHLNEIFLIFPGAQAAFGHRPIYRSKKNGGR